MESKTLRTPRQVPEAEKLRQRRRANSSKPRQLIGVKLKRKVVNAPSKPNMGAGDSQNIPEQLREITRWMLWKVVEETAGQQEDKPRKRKVPYSAHTHRVADATSERNWAPFDVAFQQYTDNKEHFSGIGFAFCDEDDLVGVDLDDCRNPDTGVLDEWAQDVVDRFSSYSEVSPSGTGVKIFVRGSWNCCKNRSGKISEEIPGSIEVYSRRRYFTVTGEMLPNSQSEVRECDTELQELADQYFSKTQSQADTLHVIGGFLPDEITDEEILEKAREAGNGDKFCRLFDDGDASDYDDDFSSADAALCSLLAFWCNLDPDRIEQLFGQSELVRDKWIERLNYRARTIQFAIDSCGEIYDWGLPEPNVVAEAIEPSDFPEDPGPIPIELLEQVPGFIKDLQQHSLDVSYKPNRTASWFGAYAALLMICQRVLADESGLRANEYSFLLMPSGSGKEAARKVVTKLAQRVGAMKYYSDSIGSGPAIEDRLLREPNMLFLPDEVHKVFSRMNNKLDINTNQFEENFLKIYTKSDSTLTIRDLVSRRTTSDLNQRQIFEPALSIAGLGIPEEFYEAMSDQQLTKGMMGRCLVFESAEAERIVPNVQSKELPNHLVRIAERWESANDARSEDPDHDQLIKLECHPDARDFRDSFGQKFLMLRLAFQRKKDPVSAALAARVAEHATKLAMVYAASTWTNTSTPLSQLKLSLNAVRWGSEVAEHNFHRMRYMAHRHVASTPFEAQRLKVIKMIQAHGEGGREISHSILLKHMRLKSPQFKQIISTLIDTHELSKINPPAGQKGGGVWYRLNIT